MLDSASISRRDYSLEVQRQNFLYVVYHDEFQICLSDIDRVEKRKDSKTNKFDGDRDKTEHNADTGSLAVTSRIICSISDL